MKIPAFCLSILLFFSCSSTGENKAPVANNNSFGAVSQRVIDAAKAYLSSQLKNPVVQVGSNGVLNFKSADISYTIEPNGINIGLLDEDALQDAIVSYVVIPNGRPKYTKQLILLNKGNMKVVKDFASELRVMQISNRTIFGELPSHGPDSPLHTCNECKQTVKYKLSGDSLQLIKE